MVPKMFAAADTDYSHPAGAAHCVCVGRDLPEALASIVISSGYLLRLHINTALPARGHQRGTTTGFWGHDASKFSHPAPPGCGRQGATATVRPHN